MKLQIESNGIARFNHARIKLAELLDKQNQTQYKAFLSQLRKPIP